MIAVRFEPFGWMENIGEPPVSIELMMQVDAESTILLEMLF